MREKNWFIFKGDHHLGPFTFNEILNKVKLLEVNDEELLWREGDPDWKPVFDQEDIIGALAQEKEEARQQRQKLEDQTRAAQRQEFAARMQKEKEEQEKRDQEKVKAIALKKQRQRQQVLDEEIARKQREDSIKEAQKLELTETKEHEDDGPPPLPPLPIEDPPEAEVEISQQLVEQEVLTFAKSANVEQELHEQVSSEDEGYSEEFYEEELAENVSEEEDYTDEVQIEVKGRSFYISLGLIGFVAIVLVFSYSYLFSGQRSLKGLRKRDRDTLTNISTRPFSGKALHRLRATAKLDSLWLASNFPGEAAVYLRLESIIGQVLGDAPVIVQGSSVFKGQAALFKELEIIQGTKLLPGKYKYQIAGYQIGLMKNLAKGLGGLPVFRELKAFRPERSKFHFTGELLISSTSEKEFNILLEKRTKNIERKVLRPLKDRRQRLKTFMSFLNQVESIYNNILGRITMGKSMHLFEKRYNKEVGPYLRDLIIDTNRVHISLTNFDPKESKAYEEVMNFGKDVGYIASEMVTKTRKIRRLGRAKTEVMKEKFRLDVEELRVKGKEQLYKMNAVINKYEELEKK